MPLDDDASVYGHYCGEFTYIHAASYAIYCGQVPSGERADDSDYNRVLSVAWTQAKFIDED